MNIGTLYFLSSRGETRLVKENLPKDKIIPAINEYVKKLNPNFKIYYVRSWDTDEKTTKFDVGSHTEFFKWEAMA